MEGSMFLWRMINPVNPGSRMFVSRKPGDGGVDWEYTKDPLKAMRASEHWRRRFFANCKRCGDSDFNYGAF